MRIQKILIMPENYEPYSAEEQQKIKNIMSRISQLETKRSCSSTEPFTNYELEYLKNYLLSMEIFHWNQCPYLNCHRCIKYLRGPSKHYN